MDQALQPRYPFDPFWTQHQNKTKKTYTTESETGSGDHEHSLRVPVFAQHQYTEGPQLVQTGYLRDEVVIKVEKHEPRETRKVFAQPRYRVVLQVEEA